MKRVLVQFGCTFFVTTLTAMTSFSNSWPSSALRVLSSDQSPLGFKISTNEGNIISSIPMLGSLLSTLVAGYVSESLGRKKTLILCGLLYVATWSLITTARSTLQIILGRFTAGLGSGVAFVAVLVYISEITQLSIRGSTTSIASLLYAMGVLMANLLGWFLSYNVICYISLTAAVIFVMLMTCLKETPPYLLKIGRNKEALISLKFYRGVSETTEAILEELSYLKSQNQNNQINRDAETPLALSEKEKLEYENTNKNSENKSPWILLFTVPHNRRALITIGTFVLLTVSMGMVAVQTYTNQFFATAAPTLSSDLCSVLFSLVLVVSSFLSIMVTDLVARRTLMISTCAVTTVCLGTLGALLRWPGAPLWVAVLVILVYCIVFQLGVINIVFIQLGESFGPQVNSAAAAILLCLMFATNFIVLFLFVPAVGYLGIDGTFFIFATIGAVTTVMSAIWMKETRRLPLEDVQKMYAKGFLCRRVSETET